MLTSVVPTYDWYWCSSRYNKPRKPRDMKEVLIVGNYLVTIS